MKFKYLFVITYGRSGSTLLAGLLNLVPGALIRGENHGALNHLYRAVRSAERTQTQPGVRPEDTPADPWFGARSVAPAAFRKELVEAFVRHVLVPPPEASLLGFKEIRFRLGDFTEDEFLDFLAFLREAFERPCFVFNVRRHADVARSAWWAEERGARAELAELDRRFRLAAARHADISAWVDYDRLLAEPASIGGLYDFIGAEVDEAAVRTVFATPHSYVAEAPPPLPPWRRVKDGVRRSLRRLTGAS